MLTLFLEACTFPVDKPRPREALLTTQRAIRADNIIPVRWFEAFARY